MNQTSSSTCPKGVCEFLMAVNIFLSITASLGNALILVALDKESCLHPPTKLLFRCLAVTDLCVGLVAQPFFTVTVISFITTTITWDVRFYAEKIYNASSIILCQVSVYVSTAISVDRLLALLLGLRYRHVVTLRRVRTVLICFWLISVSLASIFFWNRKIGFTVGLNGLISFSIAASVFSYTKIYLKLRHHQLQMHVSQGQPKGGRIPLNIARYKKSVSSVLWVQLALVACYVPFIIVVTLTTYYQMSERNIDIPFLFTATLTYLNSSLNPVLYCWRMGAVRNAAKDTIKKLSCCKSA